MKYDALIKGIIGGAAAIGSMVAANLFAKQQKVDKTADDVSEIKRRLNSARLQSGEAETIDIDDFTEGFAASDQDVDNAI